MQLAVAHGLVAHALEDTVVVGEAAGRGSAVAVWILGVAGGVYMSGLASEEELFARDMPFHWRVGWVNEYLPA